MAREWSADPVMKALLHAHDHIFTDHPPEPTGTM
jgi:hypothetical protein